MSQQVKIGQIWTYLGWGPTPLQVTQVDYHTGMALLDGIWVAAAGMLSNSGWTLVQDVHTHSADIYGGKRAEDLYHEMPFLYGPPKCDCGGAKARTSHSHWCSSVTR